MTNGEKYKTAQERAEAFEEWVRDRCGRGVCEHCEANVMCNVYRSVGKLLSWLDLEAKEKPETIEDIVKELRNEPLGEGGAKPWLHYLADRIIAAHNRVAKKCSGVEE